MALVHGTTPKTPFSRAVDEFLEGLRQEDGHERNPFFKELNQEQLRMANTNDTHTCNTQSQISAESLKSFLANLDREKRDSRGVRILERVSPFIDALKKLMLACETAAKATPFGVSIAFAGVRVVLDLAIRMQNFFDCLMSAMDDMALRLKCYEQFAYAHASSPEIQDQLVMVYKKLIRFWWSICGTLSQHRLKTVVKSIYKPLDDDIKNVLKDLEQVESRVKSFAQSTVDSQARRDREEALRQRITDWIMPVNERVDFRADLKEQLDRRHDGTCQWMFEDERFKQWRSATESSVLWYNASPGSGKTVLASTIVERLKQEGEKVAYFFYSFNSHLRQHGVKGLRSVALQILLCLDTPPDVVVDTYNNEMRHQAVTLQVSRLAARVVHDLVNQCNQAYIIIDGLDECKDMDLTLETMLELVRMPTYGIVKWLFTSRDYQAIRTVMDQSGAVEIHPLASKVSEDITKYFSAHIKCRYCVDERIKGEDNFLYARFVCETLGGQGFTCTEEIQQALHAFPKNLNAYYLRSLERLSEKTEVEQELARRTFLVLTTAAQSITADELLNVLAVRRGLKDHTPYRRRSLKIVTELCGPLVFNDELTKGGSKKNPILKLCHKSVQDFFLQNPDSITGMEKSPHLHKYFVTPDQANLELGLDCLTYLSYERYQKPGLDLSSLCSKDTVPEDHAFLLYAATFWAQHLTVSNPSPEVIEAVMKFVKNPAFWNCLSVQARVVPYLFARYVHRGRGTYMMGGKRSKWTDKDYFALPLPTWLDSYSEMGMLMDRSLCCFVDDWREVFTTSPQGLDCCVPLRRFEAGCHLAPLTKSKTLKIAHLQDSIHEYLQYSAIRLLMAEFRGKTVWVEAVCLRQDDNATGTKWKRIQVPLFSRKPIQENFVDILFRQGETNWTVSVARQAGSPDKIEALSLDPKTLSLRRVGSDQSEEHRVPLSFSRENIGRRKGDWEVVATQELGLGTNKGISMQILHGKLRTHVAAWYKHPASQSGESEAEDADDDSDREPAEEKEAESSDDDESDDDSDSDSKAIRSHAETEMEHESSETDLDSDSDEAAITDCLVMVSYSGRPFWHTWSNSSRLWSKVTCAMHPTLPLLSLTHTRRELVVIQVPEWTVKTSHLPEPTDLQDTPPASLRELRFSPCGNYVHFLSISFTPDKATTVAHVTLSFFSFNHEGGVDDTLRREGQSQHCTYAFDDSLQDVPVPLVLTHWSDTHVLIALPPLTCDPKILKITLPRGPGGPEGDAQQGETCIKALARPIYFPTSTTCRRSPRLLYRAEGQKSICSYLYLALDALSPGDERHREPRASGSSSERPATSLGGGSTKALPIATENELRRGSPPVVLRWKINQTGAWRSWDAEVDGRAAGLKRGLSAWKMLQGEFVDSEKAFSVPIRSGLDWKRKGVLSCG